MNDQQDFMKEIFFIFISNQHILTPTMCEILCSMAQNIKIIEPCPQRLHKPDNEFTNNCDIRQNIVCCK